MGIPFSCPSLDDWDAHFSEVLMRSLSFEDDNNAKALWRSISFNGRDSHQKSIKSFGSRKMILKGSLSFNARDLETLISISTPHRERKIITRQSNQIENSEGQDSSAGEKSENRRYQAALRLQKVYKSFRTRRRLADCAVLVEQKWWKLLDFAELKRSSISFFDIEKPETATSRWSRARTRAAKVGKGLSKDEKARKLALQHWLEAIDPRHRYGHNLQFYYSKWLRCDSKQPFFYWLDIGEGKEVNVIDRCPRSKLQYQCIKYLGPAERLAYEVVVENGKFLYKLSRKLLNTAREHEEAKWIFVLSTSKTLYVGQKTKGMFQHSSFLAGGATLSAGRLVVEEGILKAVWPHSGHYLPTEENFQEFMAFLRESNIDLSQVKRNTMNEEIARVSWKNIKRISARGHPEAETSHKKGTDPEHKEINFNVQSCRNERHSRPLMSRMSSKLASKLTKLEIPERHETIDELEEEQEQEPDPFPSLSPMDGYETAEETFLSDDEFIIPKLNLFEEESDEEEEAAISRETILRRINLHRKTKSYQLAQRLSSKWTTGAGPRIGCMRDYPSRLQYRILEQSNLSPRAIPSTQSSSRLGAWNSDIQNIDRSPRGSMIPDFLNKNEDPIMED